MMKWGNKMIDLLYYLTMARYRRLHSDLYNLDLNRKRRNPRKKVKGIKYFGTYRPIKHFGE